MTEEATIEEQPEISLELFHPKKAELVSLAAQYKDLTIKGIDDKEGYKAVHDARMVLVKARTGINATRKSYTKQFDEAKARAMTLEKELLGVISPVEEALLKQEEAIDAEKERIKEEEKRKAQEILNARVAAFAQYGYSHDLFDLQLMEDARFEEILADKKAAWEESERIRVEQEEKERKEREDFENKKREMEAKEKEIADREAALKAAQDAIDEEKRAKDRAAEIERERADAAEKAKKETEDRMKREQEEKEKREALEAERKAQEAAAEQALLEKRKKYKDWIDSLTK